MHISDHLITEAQVTARSVLILRVCALSCAAKRLQFVRQLLISILIYFLICCLSDFRVYLTRVCGYRAIVVYNVQINILYLYEMKL